jgi:hypothetical protein
LPETLAIGVEKRLEGQDPRVAFRQPRHRAVDSDGKLDMRDPDEIGTQFEHGRGRGETPAELTAVAVPGSYVVRLSTV